MLASIRKGWISQVLVYDELASSNMFILLVSAEPSAGRAVCMNNLVCVCVGGQVCSEINSSLRTEGVLSQYEEFDLISAKKTPTVST